MKNLGRLFESTLHDKARLHLVVSDVDDHRRRGMLASTAKVMYYTDTQLLVF